MNVVVVAYLTHNVSMCFESIEAVVETLHGCWKWCKDMSLYYNQNHGVLHANIYIHIGKVLYDDDISYVFM